MSGNFGSIVGPRYIAVGYNKIPSIELNRVTLKSALTCLRINCLLAHLPLHHLVRLASMKTYEVALSTKLRFIVETISHSTMSHDLGNVGFVLTTERLLVDSQTLTRFSEGPCYKSIEPLFVTRSI